MKKFFLSILAGLSVIGVFAQADITTALASPSTTTELVLNGKNNDASLLVKNAGKFTALTTILVTGISDSMALEQEVMAVAACPGVNTLVLKNYGVKKLSGAFGMLTSVRTVTIYDRGQLDLSNSFFTLSRMPSLEVLNYTTSAMTSVPRSIAFLKGLSEINIVNNDITLADGYALNTQSRESLQTTENLSLGIAGDKLDIFYTCYNEKVAASHLSLIRDVMQGVMVPEEQLVFPRPAAPFKMENPLVKPPLAGVDVASNMYSTDAKKGGEITYPSGTKISIPENAFVDANGNPVKGNVTVQYREFRDPVDILISGIPMTYDSAGQTGEFQSAGMFEMTASVNGQEVFLAPGKDVKMEFAVVDTASTYNFYKLDPQQGWQFIEPLGKTDGGAADSAQKAAAPDSASFSGASDKYLRHLSTFYKRKYFDPGDTTAFDRIWQDTNYVGMQTLPRPQVYTRKATNHYYRMATNWRLLRVPAQKGTSCFRLVRVQNPWHSYVNPEMNIYAGTTFMFDEKIDKELYRQLRRTRSGITDIRMNYDGGNSYTMEMKFPDGFKSFSVSAVYSHRDSLIDVREKACARMNFRYTHQLERRKTVYDRRTFRRVRREQSSLRLISQDSFTTWNSLKPRMSEKERALSFDEWNEYALANTKLIRQNGSNTGMLNDALQPNAASSLTQALTILSFGIYNCDQVQRINHAKTVFATIVTAVGAYIKAKSVYVIDKHKNQCYSYWGDGNVQITYGEEATNVLVTIDDEDGVYITQPDQLLQQRTGDHNSAIITADWYTDGVLTAQDLRNIIYPEKKK